MDTTLDVRRRRAGARWLGIEFGAVAALVTIAWLNEPSSLGRFALMCACWAPYIYGAAVLVRRRLRSSG
jgi:hypothetical protein